MMGFGGTANGRQVIRTTWMTSLVNWFGGVPNGDFLHAPLHRCLLFCEAFQLQRQVSHGFKKVLRLILLLCPVEGNQLDMVAMSRALIILFLFIQAELGNI